jgi:peptidoglycan/xylan/chitin deacetylase (PgdA/CDA1 family)
MTIVYLTIDTEYAFRLPGIGGPGTCADNFARSIACETPAGAVGVHHQMDVLDRYGLKAVFFVDPMPALLWGVEAIADVVRPIAARGHDIQLHCHTEWLAYDRAGRLAGGRTGRNIKDFPLAEQRRILAWARDTLIAAGAPAPVAFRAGNYGANDATLEVLAELGFGYDASHCPALAGSGDCAITLGTSIAP